MSAGGLFRVGPAIPHQHTKTAKRIDVIVEKKRNGRKINPRKAGMLWQTGHSFDVSVMSRSSSMDTIHCIQDHIAVRFDGADLSLAE